MDMLLNHQWEEVLERILVFFFCLCVDGLIIFPNLIDLSSDKTLLAQITACRDSLQFLTGIWDMRCGKSLCMLCE